MVRMEENPWRHKIEEHLDVRTTVRGVKATLARSDLQGLQPQPKPAPGPELHFPGARSGGPRKKGHKVEPGLYARHKATRVDCAHRGG